MDSLHFIELITYLYLMVHTWQKWCLLNVSVACGRSLKRWSSALRIFSVLATMDKLNLYSTCSLRTAMEIVSLESRTARQYFTFYSSQMQTSARTNLILHLSKKLRTVFPSRRYGSLVTPSTSATVLYRSSMY